MRESQQPGVGVTIDHAVVRAALKSIQNVAALSASPLCQLKIIQSRSGTPTGLALKGWLTQGIERLKLEGEPDWHARAWQPYLILRELHLRDGNHEQVMAQLAVSRAHHFRLYAQAVDALTLQLQQTAASAEPSDVPLSQRPLAPTPAICFVGREIVLAQLKQQLKAHTPIQRIAIYGLPGVGKTALLAQLAHDPELRALFPGGILWLALGQVPDLAVCLQGLAEAVGVAVDARQSINELMRTIRNALQGRSCLLLVDDVWAADAALTMDIGCPTLFATRFPEVATRLAGPNTIALKELDEADSTKLLGWFAPHVAHEYRDAVRGVVSATGGLPMALTLAGHLLARAGHAAQPRRIQQALTQLGEADFRLQMSTPDIATTVPSQAGRSLFAVIAASDAALSAAARRMLYGLSIFPAKPNSFSETSALAIGAEHSDALDELVDLGLLETPSPGRYALHQTIADYATLQVTDSNHRRRMADYFAQFVEAHADQFDMLAGELVNIFVALGIIQQNGDHPRLIHMANALFPCLDSRSMWVRADALYEHVIPVTPTEPPSPEQAQALINAGNIAFQLNQLDRAEAFANACRSANAPTVPIALQHEALHLLTRIASERTAFDSALLYAQEALSAAKQSQRADLIAAAQAITAMVQGMRGRLAQARQVFGEDSPLPDNLLQRMQTRAQVGQTQARLVLGITAFFGGKLQEAESSLTNTLAACQRLRHPRLTTATQAILSAVLHARGNYADALAMATEGLAISETLEQADMTAMLHHSVGLVALSRGEWALADSALAQAVTQARTAKLHPVLATVLTAQSRLYIERNQRAEARTAIEEALALSKLRFQQIGPIAILGRLAALDGHFDSAQVQCIKAIKSCNGPFSSATLTAFALLQRGECRLDASEAVLAMTDFEQALAAAQKVGYPEFVGMAQFGLARAAHGQGKRDVARRMADQSLKTFRELGHGYERRVIAFIPTSS